ncbi:MAG: hypothetical protein AAB631_01920, partial [Patescibacteria group bacterium]
NNDTTTVFSKIINTRQTFKLSTSTTDWTNIPVGSTITAIDITFSANAAIDEYSVCAGGSAPTISVYPTAKSVRVLDGASTDFGSAITMTDTFTSSTQSHSISYVKGTTSTLEVGLTIPDDGTCDDGDGGSYSNSIYVQLSKVYATITYTPPAISITIAGTIYQDEGVTATSSTVKVVVGGSVASSTSAGAPGTYTVTMTQPSTSTVITVYMDNGSATRVGATVTRYSGTNLSGIDVYRGRVILRHEDSGPITNANVGTYDSVSDTDIPFTVSGGVLNATSAKVIVASGKTFQPGGAVNVGALYVIGTFTPDGNTITLNRPGTSATCTGALNTVIPFCVSGTFTIGTSTINYTATSSVTLAAVAYYNFGVGTTADSSAVTFTLGGNATAAGVVTVGNAGSGNSDTLALSIATLTLSSSGTPFVITSKGTLSGGTGTVSYTATTATTIAVSDAYYGLQVGVSADASAVTYTLGGDTTVTNRVTIGNSGSSATDTFSPGPYTLTISGIGRIISTPLQITSYGALPSTTGTVAFSGNGSTDIPATSYFNLSLKPQSTNIYYLATTTGQTITVNGDFRLFRDAAATVDASSYNPSITVKGNFIVGDCTSVCGTNQLTYTKGTGTITLSPGGTKTLQDSNPALQDLGIISINTNGSTPYTVQLNSDIVATSITMTSGGGGSATLSATSTKTITVTGTGSPFVVQGYPGGEIPNPGVFNAASSTVRYIGITTSTNIGAATYWDLFVGTSTGSTTYTLRVGTGGYSTIQNTITVASSTTGTNTLNGGTGSIYLLGSGTPFVIAPTGATSTPGSSTFSYRGSSATTITAATYWNLDTNGTATYTLGGAATVSNDVTVTAGTLAGTSNFTVNGGDITGAGTVTLTGGTATISGAGSLGGATNWTFSSLTVNGSSQTTTSTGAGAMTVSGVLTVSAGHTFSAGGKTWTLSNVGNVATPFLLSGTFNAVTSTVQFTGNYTVGNTLVASTTYYKLTLNNASEVFALQSPSTVNNLFTVATGTATFAGGGTFAFNSDYLNNGQGGASTGTVTFGATSTGHMINAGALAAGFQVSLPTVVFNGSGGGWSFATSTAVIDSLLVANGTLDNSNGSANIQLIGNATTSSITCGATCGTVNLTNVDHTVTFYTTGGTLGTTSGSNDWTFNNLTTTCASCGGNHEAGSRLYLGSGGTGNLVVKKVWTMNPSADIYARGRTIQFSGTGTPMVVSDTITFQAGTSTVVYAGQTTSTMVTANPYYNLQVGTSTATTTYTFSGDTTVNNILTINDSSNGTNTLAGSSYTITFASSGTPFVINESPVSLAFSAGTGKVKYNGAAVTTITVATYYNLDVMPSSTSAHQFAAGTFIVGGQLTAGDGTHTGVVDASPNNTTISVTGAMLIATSSTFKANAVRTISIGGNYTNNGTFTHNSGQVTFNGTSAQTLTGSMGPMEVGTSAFNHLAFSNNSGTLAAPAIRLTADATTVATSTIVTASTTVRFNAGSTYTFNSLNWNGQATTSRVGVRSSSAGSPWLLTVAGAKIVSSTDVKDSDACGSGSISVTDDSLDSGGNSCWIWPLPGTPGTPTFPYVTGVSVVVNWTAASSTTSYNLFRSTSSGGIYVLVASTTITSSTDTGLTQSTTYWYKVMGVNSYGNGPTSTAASVTTLTVSQGYATSSSLTSVIYDTAVASGTAPNSITWQGTRPTNTTVKFQFAGSDTTSSPWTYTAWNGSGSNNPSVACDSNSYYPPTGTSEPNTAVELKAVCQQNKRYIRYKVFLETTSSSTTPTVTDIILNYAK